jgi:hypothetical protein
MEEHTLCIVINLINFDLCVRFKLKSCTGIIEKNAIC